MEDLPAKICSGLYFLSIIVGVVYVRRKMRSARRPKKQIRFRGRAHNEKTDTQS